MSLVLTIVRQPPGISNEQTRMSFGAEGGTIGRNADNSWQLPDPDRFVSSRHASIRCEGGQYYLVDTSTNGVYYNNTQEPLGTGNQAKLSEGDRLYFGEYELLVEFEQSPAADNMNLNDFDQWLDPEPASDILADSAGGAIGNDFLSETEELDPLAALDNAIPSSNEFSSGGIPDEDWLGASQPDNAPAMEQAFSVPDPVLGSVVEPVASQTQEPAVDVSTSDQSIPDDWDIDDLLGDGGPLESTPAPSPVPSPSIPKPTPSKPALPPKPIKSKLPETPVVDENDVADSEDVLGELDSLLSVEVDLPDAQQDVLDVAQRESDELDAFLGLDDAPESTSEPSLTDDFASDLAPDAEEPYLEPEFNGASDGFPDNMDFITPSNEDLTESEITSAIPENILESAPDASPCPEPAKADGTSEGLIRALGLDPEQVQPEQKAHFEQLMADLLRESTKGLMQVLGARNAIKNEFRMNVTLIQAAENNPLKFSPTVDEALKNMFVSQSNAYLPGLLAVRHGFQDIADHQIAVIAGMREAFNSMMQQFDPTKLASRFEKQHIRGGLMKGKSAKYWESYTEYYQNLANNMEDAFQDLFGEDFAEAYEQQMNTLAASRKQDRH